MHTLVLACRASVTKVFGIFVFSRKEKKYIAVHVAFVAKTLKYFYLLLSCWLTQFCLSRFIL